MLQHAAGFNALQRMKSVRLFEGVDVGRGAGIDLRAGLDANVAGSIGVTGDANPLRRLIPFINRLQIISRERCVRQCRRIGEGIALKNAVCEEFEEVRFD